MYIDFHTHKPIYSNDREVIEIISAHKNVKYENEYYTIGHHPWWTENPLNKVEINDLQQNLHSKFCLGIGECGLDKLKGATKEIQEEIFYQQIQIANQHNVPLIVHCVRQYDQILHFRKQYGKTPWVIHGFRRNQQLAKSLLDQGANLSVSPFENMNTSFKEMLKYIPLNGFFVETDSEYSLNIKERYAILANLKQITLSDLQNQMLTNFTNFFK
ncbi:MAG: TatD family hydrolase [Arcicella sp.]|nr:TatD family hydrolase [Arcicella sp.]